MTETVDEEWGGNHPEPAGASKATIRYELHSTPGVRVLTIDRPRKMNAIGPVEARALDRAISGFEADPEARVLVMTGAGGDAFCSGADLHSVASLAGIEDGEPLFVPEDPANPSSPPEGNIGPTRRTDLFKPVIAAVNGAAYAGGLEWACFAHLRVADSHASFGVTCRRWNVGLGDGGTQRLPRIIGLGRALDLILTGRVIGAREAERIGLVNEVTPSGHCLERALEIASTLSRLPQGAMRTDLEATIRGSGLPLVDGLEVERECFDRLLVDPELIEGASRFLSRDHEDRAPDAPALHPPGRAWSFARKAHQGEVDRFGRDFIEHPAAVAELSVDLGETALTVAYLHDTVEKAGTDPEEIERLFGREVRQMVETLGQDPSIQDGIARREDHRRRIAAAGRIEQAVYLNDRRESILTLTTLLESGRDPEEFDAARRVSLWQGDLDAVDPEKVDPAMLSTIRQELQRLASTLD